MICFVFWTKLSIKIIFVNFYFLKILVLFISFQNTNKSSIFSKYCFFGSAITWLKIIRTLQVGGVLETTGPPLNDGHLAEKWT